MLHLIKLDSENQRISFDFARTNNPNWKKAYVAKFILAGSSIPKQGNLSDFDYYLLLRREIAKTPWFSPTEEYMLMDDSLPITEIYLIKRNANVIDISFTTHINHRGKGYASKALEMIENVLFKDENTFFTTMTDMSPNGETTKIARKAGYIFNDKSGYFIKFNPNKNIEDFTKIKPSI